MIIDWNSQDIGNYALGWLLDWSTGASVTPSGGAANDQRVSIGTIFGLKTPEPRIGGF
jgi:hypothetical protein